MEGNITHEKFKRKKDEISLLKQVENIFVKAREMNKTATMLNQYCKAFIKDEKIYNISSITQLLEDESESIFKDLLSIINSKTHLPLPKFILNIKENNTYINYED